MLLQQNWCPPGTPSAVQFYICYIWFGTSIIFDLIMCYFECKYSYRVLPFISPLWVVMTAETNVLCQRAVDQTVHTDILLVVTLMPDSYKNILFTSSHFHSFISFFIRLLRHVTNKRAIGNPLRPIPSQKNTWHPAPCSTGLRHTDRTSVWKAQLSTSETWRGCGLLIDSAQLTCPMWKKYLTPRAMVVPHQSMETTECAVFHSMAARHNARSSCDRIVDESVP